MVSSYGASRRLAILPLAKDAVLLPGVTLRIPISNRPDIPVLLASLFSPAASPRASNSSVIVGCVPLNSPFLSKDGQQLINGHDGESRPPDPVVVDVSRATKEDLFTFGTTAKVIGVQGRANADPYLLVEGVQRFSIRRITKERPFFEADVMLLEEAGN
jgi:ATP-dependent Lon protease